MRNEDSIFNQIDWLSVFLYLALVTLGWLNIYAAVYDEEAAQSIFNLSTNSGKQLIRIAASGVIILVIVVVDFKVYESLAYFIFGAMILILIAVLFFGTEISGSRSWFQFAGISIQPSEFAKFATALAMAKYLSNTGVKLDNIKHLFKSFMIFLIPAALIVMQGDAGTAMVFSAFLIVLYREGMNPTLIIVGLIAAAVFIITLLVEELFLFAGIAALALLVILFIQKTRKNIIGVLIGALVLVGVVKSVNFIFSNVLKPYHQNRIMVMINPDSDPLGYGWNITQSKIAIGSGGFTGKGFLKGTQTKFDFVPEQSTDFIFCTIGEEHGWIGSVLLIGLFITLLFRIVAIAERQKIRFARIYGYSVASILFFHFAVNIAMTIGFFPVIGIPLPFFSYGGSSLWGFTILLFILLKLDAHRMELLTR